MKGPNLAALHAWIVQNMPELGAELAPLPVRDWRPRLNEVTGLDVEGSACLEYAADCYLQALQVLAEAEEE